MRREMGALCYEINDLVAKQVRFATADTDSEIAVYGVQSAKQVNKMLVGRTSEIAYIDSAEDQFFSTSLDGLCGLADDSSNRGIAAFTTR